MILTAMPDLPPRPQSDGNAHFRRWFYARWGRENALICGRTRHAEYVPLTQTLSVKAAWGGAERYFLPGREVAVDDDSVLILNEGSRYGSLIRSHRAAQPAWSCAVFFAPGLQQAVAAQRGQNLAAALDDPAPAPRECRFGEHLRRDAPALQQRLAAITAAAHAGESSQDWLDEQCLLLLSGMHALDAAPAVSPEAASPRRAARIELLRRLRLAADFIDSEYVRPLTLAQMAAVACLSPYHFVRRFGAAFGLTPHAWLCAKRARVAARLLREPGADVTAVAATVGFGSVSALRRALRALPAAPAQGPAPQPPRPAQSAISAR